MVMSVLLITDYRITPLIQPMLADRIVDVEFYKLFLFVFMLMSILLVLLILLTDLLLLIQPIDR